MEPRRDRRRSPSGAHRRYAAASGRTLRAAQGRREAACHRSSKMSFRGHAKRADEEFPFTETLAVPNGCATALTWDHAQSGVVVRDIGTLSRGNRRNRAKTEHFRSFQCKITRLRPLWKTLLHCKNTVSGSRSAARKTTRWSAARANIPTISACPGRPMPGSCAPATPTASSAASTPRPPRRCRACSASGPATDLAAADYGPFTCGLPLKNRDGSPLLQTNRMALMTDKVRYRRRSRGLRGGRDAGAGARRRPKPSYSISMPLPAVTNAEEAASPARRSSTITSPTTWRWIITMATPPRSMPPSRAPRT